jgi:hypothetical protein
MSALNTPLAGEGFDSLDELDKFVPDEAPGGWSERGWEALKGRGCLSGGFATLL